MPESWKLATCTVVSGCVGAAVVYGCSSKGTQGVDRVKILKEHVIPYDEKNRWSATDVAAWLISKGVSGEAAVLLEQEGIDGTVLPQITLDMISELGIHKLGDRMKLQKIIEQYNASEPSRTNPLAPEAGNLPETRKPADKSSEAAPAEQSDAFDAKYTEVVQGHVKSLNKIVTFLDSEEFKRSPSPLKKVQLQKVVELLTKLIEFTDDLPEKHGAVLLQYIQRVYSEVKQHDVDEDEAEETGAETRIGKIRQLKKHLVENPSANLPETMELLREVVGDIDNITDEEEIVELNAVFKMLQSRSGARQEEIKSQEAEGAVANEGVKKLLMAARLFDTNFIKQSLEKQAEHIKLGTHILHEYEDSTHCDSSIAKKFSDLIQTKIGEHMALKNTTQGEASDPLESKLANIVKLLKEESFPNLGLEQQFKVLEHAYQTLDSLSQDELSANYPLTSQLVALLKQRHAETSDNSLVKEALAKQDGEEGEGEGENEGPDTTPQNEINLLPKVYQRLKSDDFVDRTSEFEFNTLLWVVAQISQVLQSVVSEDKFRELMEPVHKMLMVRMDQAKAMPASRMEGLKGYSFVEEDGHFTLQETEEPSQVVQKLEDEKSHGVMHDGDKEKPMVAVLVGCDTPDGTEALEIQHMAYMLKKELGYRVIMLVGGEAEKAGVESVLQGLGNEVSLVLIRGGETNTKETITIAGEEVSLEWLKETVTAPSCCLILDFLSSCTLATASDDITLHLPAECIPKVTSACSWLFSGFFTPLLAEILTSKTPPTLLHNVVHHLQTYITHDDTSVEIMEREFQEGGLQTCCISRGPKLEEENYSSENEGDEDEAGE